ncbi:MAG: hypothetical protein K1X91_06030 [Bacteriodetes bacterium]|nr:hypothetical protein [Bacteroidota bacterium]
MTNTKKYLIMAAIYFIVLLAIQYLFEAFDTSSEHQDVSLRKLIVSPLISTIFFIAIQYYIEKRAIKKQTGSK